MESNKLIKQTNKKCQGGGEYIKMSAEKREICNKMSTEKQSETLEAE